MAWSCPQYLLMQLSPLTHTSLEAFSLHSCRRFRCSALAGGCDGLRSCRAQASPFARRLANLRHRIEFTCVWDCSFAPGCFPPSLAATQLPFASPPVPGSVAIRVALIGLYVVMVTRAGASSHRTNVWTLWLARRRCAPGTVLRYPNKTNFPRTLICTQ